MSANTNAKGCFNAGLALDNDRLRALINKLSSMRMDLDSDDEDFEEAVNSTAQNPPAPLEARSSESAKEDKPHGGGLGEASANSRNRGNHQPDGAVSGGSPPGKRPRYHIESDDDDSGDDSAIPLVSISIRSPFSRRSILKEVDEDMIFTETRRFSLSISGLVMENIDGLQPKLASDIESFKNAFLEIKESPVSGFGIFAVCDIDAFTPILVERKLFTANTFNLYKQLESLTAEQLKAFNNLHGHKRTPCEDTRTAIWQTNNFCVKDSGAVFLLASRFNHACGNRNNVDYSYDCRKQCMAFVTNKPVKAGDELFIRYGGDPIHLYMTWGFRCKCGGCKGVSDEAIRAATVAWDEPHY